MHAGATPRNCLRDTTADRIYQTAQCSHVCRAPSLEVLFLMHASAARSPREHSALGMQTSRPGRLDCPGRAGQLGRQLRPARSRAVEPPLIGRAPGLASFQPPPPPISRRGRGVAGGYGRRPACAHAGALRSLRTMTRQDPGQDRVYQERLQQLRARLAARGGQTIPTLPPLKPTVDKWLLPKAFLPPEPQKPALLGWTPWTSSQGTPHRPRGSGLAGPTISTPPVASASSPVPHSYSWTFADERPPVASRWCARCR